MNAPIAPALHQVLRSIVPDVGPYLASALWNRGWQNPEIIQTQLSAWLKPPLQTPLQTQSLSTEWIIAAIDRLSDPYVEITLETRSLIQQAIRFLQQQAQAQTATQPGLHYLLECCNQQGDRPTDYFTGIGARLQALQQIHQNTDLRNELLTTTDRSRAKALANLAELAYVRQRGLQREVLDEVNRSLRYGNQLSLPVIIAAHPQWDFNILGQVATELAEQFDRPVFLLNTQDPLEACGVARSPIHQPIDFHAVLRSQSDLIEINSNNPYAIRFKIAQADIDLFAQAITHQFNLLNSPETKFGNAAFEPDLWVSVAELNQILYNDLRHLEPYGIGNPPVMIGIREARFEQAKNYKLTDRTQQKIEYLRTFFQLCDASAPQGIPGTWWGHYADELPIASADVILYLLNNRKQKRYEVRLIKIQTQNPSPQSPLAQSDRIEPALTPAIEQSPRSIVIEILGMVKYSARTGEPIDRSILPIPQVCQPIALRMLQDLGFQVSESSQQWQIARLDLTAPVPTELEIAKASQPVLRSLQEYQFQRRFQSQQ